jgi:hypothetical protein
MCMGRAGSEREGPQERPATPRKPIVNKSVPTSSKQGEPKTSTSPNFRKFGSLEIPTFGSLVFCWSASLEVWIFPSQMLTISKLFQTSKHRNLFCAVWITPHFGSLEVWGNWKFGIWKKFQFRCPRRPLHPPCTFLTPLLHPPYTPRAAAGNCRFVEGSDDGFADEIY